MNQTQGVIRIGYQDSGGPGARREVVTGEQVAEQGQESGPRLARLASPHVHMS
jgi:hypothetical protein